MGNPVGAGFTPEGNNAVGMLRGKLGKLGVPDVLPAGVIPPPPLGGTPQLAIVSPVTGSTIPTTHPEGITLGAAPPLSSVPK